MENLPGMSTRASQGTKAYSTKRCEMDCHRIGMGKCGRAEPGRVLLGHLADRPMASAGKVGLWARAGGAPGRYSPPEPANGSDQATAEGARSAHAAPHRSAWRATPRQPRSHNGGPARHSKTRRTQPRFAVLDSPPAAFPWRR